MIKPAMIKRYRLALQWQERIVLDDQRELLLRPIAPEDADAIRAAFVLLSPEEIRLRYQHPMKSLSEDYLHQLVHPQRGRDIVLVLVEPLPPGEALVGAVGRLSRAPGTQHAEFAIIVSRFIAGKGLGRLLLKKLVSRARRRKLHSIYGDVLDDNAPMLRLAESLGFRRESCESVGMVRVRLLLTADRHHCDDRGAGRTAA
jgi:RimJ/RimL family protein N-acetyltransferase